MINTERPYDPAPPLRYDAEYIRHFTGIAHVPVLRSVCAYTNTTYAEWFIIFKLISPPADAR
jgi:hypothetical protein